MRGVRRLPAFLLLFALGFALYLPTARNGFVNLDDNTYIYENPQVLRGLTAETALWALTSIEHANWYPLRRLSHLVDASLFGMWAGGHHLVSALWHAAAAGLLFLALELMTGARWRSFAVAALFAAHPLQVESVAWAAERSNVQAGFFFALALLLWARYARRPGAGRYAAALAGVALGMVAKPSLVTLPLLLLLLDVWPLGRAGPPGGAPWKPSSPALGRLLLEKAPMLALAAASGAIAVVAHRRFGALESLESLPLAARLGNALLSTWRYLAKLLWPEGLAVHYLHAGRDLPLGLAAAAGLGLAALTALAVATARRRPWIALGWLWYLGMLVPVSGIVQFGRHALADRFAYLPGIGVFALLVWLAAEAAPRGPRRPAALAVAAAAAVAALAAATVGQARFWRDNFTLYAHTLEVTPGNWFIENNLGMALLAEGRTAEAIEHLREAARIRPRDPRLHWNLGLAYARARRQEEAVAAFREVLRLRPSWAEARSNFAIVLSQFGLVDEAAFQLREAARLSAAQRHQGPATAPHR
jgi:tetratricopeptide (TPR) repeat protein